MMKCLSMIMAPLRDLSHRSSKLGKLVTKSRMTAASLSRSQFSQTPLDGR